MEEVSVLAGGGDGEHVLERLDFYIACGEGLDLYLVSTPYTVRVQ